MLREVVDIFKVIACILDIVPLMVITATKHVTVGTRRKGSLRSVLLQAAAAHLTTRLQLRQLLYISPNIGMDMLMTKLKRHLGHFHHYLKPFEPSCPSGRAFWLVEAKHRKPEDPVLLFFHGGGYVLSAMKEHAIFLGKMYNALNNPRLSILMHEYSLAPDSVYPKQLIEANQLFRTLVDKYGCTNITLMGDSAGGNLAIALMAHLEHGNKLVEDKPCDRHVKPTAAILLSPWVDLAPAKLGTYASNEESDYVTFEADSYMSHLYCPDETLAKSIWVSPVNATPDFWNNVLPEKLLITCGGGETALDRIQSWAASAGVSSKMYVEPQAVHVAAIFDFEGRSEHLNSGTTHIIEFCKKQLNW